MPLDVAATPVSPVTNMENTSTLLVVCCNGPAADAFVTL